MITHDMIPDTRFLTVPRHSKAMPLHGFGYILAMTQNNVCIGWIDVIDLGYHNVKQYLKEIGE